MDTPNTVNELIEMQENEVDDMSSYNAITDALNDLCDSMAMTKAVALFATKKLRESHAEVACECILDDDKDAKRKALYWADDAGRLTVAYETILEIDVEGFPNPYSKENND